MTAQAEYATDIRFKDRGQLKELFKRMLNHSTLCFGAQEVMRFLGRKLTGMYQGEVVTDLTDLAHKRLQGARVKHRAKNNWIKMYDKAGLVLRVETVINDPTAFRVRKLVNRREGRRAEWVPMRKGVAYLFRYREVSAAANGRYLDALAAVEDPTVAIRRLDRVTEPRSHGGVRVAGLNPIARKTCRLFMAVLDSKHALRGFSNRDIRDKLKATPLLPPADETTQSRRVTMMFRRLRAHGLIAKVPRSHRWRITVLGQRLMPAAIRLRETALPDLLAAA